MLSVPEVSQLFDDIMKAASKKAEPHRQLSQRLRESVWLRWRLCAFGYLG